VAEDSTSEIPLHFADAEPRHHPFTSLGTPHERRPLRLHDAAQHTFLRLAPAAYDADRPHAGGCAPKPVAVPGIPETGLAVALGALLGLAAGFNGGASLVFGMCLATASTVVIVRGLIEMDLLGSAAGRIAVGWSVVEDLITVVLLVLLPALAGTSGSDAPLWQSLLLTLAKVVTLAVVVIFGGALVVPRLLALVARAESKELFTLSVLVVALGIAFLSAEVFGVSLALGGFFGGMVVGQSDLSHQAAADALPLRDAFAVLFFVAVGMLFDPSFVVSHTWFIVAALGIVLVAKPGVAVAVMLVRGYPLRTSLSVSAGIAQVSEFSFVLAGLGVSLGMLPDEARSAVLATALLSITASPLLFRGTLPLERRLLRIKAVARFVARRAGRLAKLPVVETGALKDHAVLCGYGRVGSVLGEFLRQRGIPYVVIEQNRTLVEQLRAKGVPALYGDSGSPMLLDRARISAARSLLFTIPDPVSARLAIEHAQSKNPKIDTLVRIHHEWQREVLHRFPRTHGVHGELELAYAMARLMLQRFGVSAIESEAIVIDARRAKGVAAQTRTRIVELHVRPGSPAIGRTIAALGLPRGALIVTIAREGEFVVPGGGTILESDDALLVLADPEMARAIENILDGKVQETEEPVG
jgi:monovalent cation:H+ antiporter-2, CPA2 family